LVMLSLTTTSNLLTLLVPSLFMEKYHGCVSRMGSGYWDIRWNGVSYRLNSNIRFIDLLFRDLE
jgi:hypothetical protein